jgi:hypothetical protein
LEASLLSSLSGDLNLAARLIPRIYGLLQLRNSQTALAPTSPGPSDAEQNSDASEPSNTSSSSVTPPNGESLQKSEGRKRGRDANEDEARDERTNKRPERTDPRSAEKIDEGPPPTFACHFRKKDPIKYNPLTDRKYHIVQGSPITGYERSSKFTKVKHVSSAPDIFTGITSRRIERLSAIAAI